MGDQVDNLLVYGFKLARELESDYLSGDTRQLEPSVLLNKCNHIIQVFSGVCDQLQFALHQYHQQQQQQQGSWDVQEGQQYSSHLDAANKGKQVMPGEQLPGMKVGGGSESGSPSKKPTKKRKDETGRRTVEVEAPLHGNTELPPEDGFTWRKYGQKEILGSRFPRSYYRCTHQKLYNCPAKKQVQRLNHNPSIFQVTYRADHTCHMSSTAPAAAFPPSGTFHQLPPSHNLEPTLQHTNTTTTFHSTSLPAVMNFHDQWFTMVDPVASAPSFDFRMYHHHLETINAGGGDGGSGGTTTVQRRGEGETPPPVVVMADAMFNSGSSSGNSMDFIFSIDPQPPSSTDRRLKPDESGNKQQ